MSDYTKREYAAAREELTRTPPGHSGRFLCPLCGGGAGGELSLAVTYRDDATGFAYFCHRASCGFKGYVGGSLTGGAPPAASFEPRPYPYETELVRTPCPAWERRLSRALGAEWSWACDRAGVAQRTDAYGTELVFPLWNPWGRCAGVISRRELDDGRVVSTWRLHDVPAHSLYQPGWFQPVVSGQWSVHCVWLVEDHLSAIRLATAGRYAIALGGVHADRGLLQTVATMYPPRFVLALDPDATSLALSQAAKMRGEWGLDVWPAKIDDDIKDLGELAFQETIRQWEAVWE